MSGVSFLVPLRPHSPIGRLFETKNTSWEMSLPPTNSVDKCMCTKNAEEQFWGKCLLLVRCACRSRRGVQFSKRAVASQTLNAHLPCFWVRRCFFFVFLLNRYFSASHSPESRPVPGTPPVPTSTTAPEWPPSLECHEPNTRPTLAMTAVRTRWAVNFSPWVTLRSCSPTPNTAFRMSYSQHIHQKHLSCCMVRTR